MIFWKYVKGLNEASGANTSLYTYLEFQTNEQIDSEDKTDFEKTPIVKVNTSNALPTDGADHQDFGHIITQKAEDQSIDVPFSFTDELNIDEGATLNSRGILNTYNKINIYNSNGGDEIGSNDDVVYFKERINDQDDQWARIYMWTDYQTREQTGEIYVADQRFNLDTWKNLGIHAYQGNDTTGRPALEVNIENYDISLVVNGKCQAIYFNATSDQRAKTDLKPLSINALDLIKRVQLYSFKYKDSDLPSIGILAQDVKDVNIEGFDLVDNKEASGVDMDYMSIHESKLIYILWKAIQEQQKEIEKLKAQIKRP